MSLQNFPIGTLRRDDLLNGLLAIWKTRHGKYDVIDLDQFSQGREFGFEEGLEAIAQVTGLAEEFEARKTLFQLKLSSKINFIEGKVTSAETCSGIFPTKNVDQSKGR